MIDWSNRSFLPMYAASATGSPDRAWARARVRPQISRVERERRRDHGLDEGRTLHVAQLAPVEVAIGLGALRPAEEDVARGLHHSLALHHALAGMAVAALRQVVFENRRGRLLDLQEQRVVLVSTLQQHDERP